jgi:hypothetical protein
LENAGITDFGQGDVFKKRGQAGAYEGMRTQVRLRMKAMRVRLELKIWKSAHVRFTNDKSPEEKA